MNPNNDDDIDDIEEEEEVVTVDAPTDKYAAAFDLLKDVDVDLDMYVIKQSDKYDMPRMIQYAITKWGTIVSSQEPQDMLNGIVRVAKSLYFQGFSSKMDVEGIDDANARSFIKYLKENEAKNSADIPTLSRVCELYPFIMMNKRANYVESDSCYLFNKGYVKYKYMGTGFEIWAKKDSEFLDYLTGIAKMLQQRFSLNSVKRGRTITINSGIVNIVAKAIANNPKKDDKLTCLPANHNILRHYEGFIDWMEKLTDEQKGIINGKLNVKSDSFKAAYNDIEE